MIKCEICRIILYVMPLDTTIQRYIFLWIVGLSMSFLLSDACDAVAQQCAEYRDGGHGFDNGHGARHYARVVTPMYFEGDGAMLAVYGLHRTQQCGYGFEGHAHYDWFAV